MFHLFFGGILATATHFSLIVILNAFAVQTHPTLTVTCWDVTLGKPSAVAQQHLWRGAAKYPSRGMKGSLSLIANARLQFRLPKMTQPAFRFWGQQGDIGNKELFIFTESFKNSIFMLACMVFLCVILKSGTCYH